MKLSEAYSVLGLNPDASEDEVKKKFRVLAAKAHPDVCKDADADAKFKRINEAYQTIQKGEDEQEMPQGFPFDFSNPFGFGGINLQDFFGGRQQNPQAAYMPDVAIHLNISFKEAVFGCKKNVEVERLGACKTCSGSGSKPVGDKCPHCKGVGRTRQFRGSMMFEQTCIHCFGAGGKRERCPDCQGSGSVKAKTKLSVQIPGGVRSGQKLGLDGAGHHLGSGTYGRATVSVSVDPDPRFEMGGNDVFSTLNISLKDAVNGCKINVPTLEGEREVSVAEYSKHGDRIIIPNMGVQKRGSQVVILNIQYPDNIKELVH
jgi:molecular chaperone DnaJ